MMIGCCDERMIELVGFNWLDPQRLEHFMTNLQSSEGTRRTKGRDAYTVGLENREEMESSQLAPAICQYG
jgi:hypothetical protein